MLAFAGTDTTAGLDMPRFFGPGAERDGGRTPDWVVPFGLGQPCLEPVVVALQGITYTIGIALAAFVERRAARFEGR